MTDTPTITATFNRFVEFINSADETISDEVISPNATFHTPGSDEPLHGPTGWLKVLRAMRSAFPDIRWRVIETITEAPTLVARFTVTGTHSGDFLGIPATGRAVTFEATNFYRFEEGKIVAELGQPDLMTLFAQIGTPRGPVGF